MKWRGLLVALATMAMLAIPGTALAKGPSQARLDGPGLSNPIVLRGDGEPGSGGSLSQLVEQTGLFPAMFGQEPNPMTSTRPGGALGPHYVVTYVVPAGTGQDEIRQDLFPYAAGGPLAYTRPGQPFFGTQATLGGWFRAPGVLTATLTSLGVPTQPPDAAVNPAVNKAEPPSSNDAAGSDLPLSRVLLAASALVALAALGVGLRLRRRRMA